MEATKRLVTDTTTNAALAKELATARAHVDRYSEVAGKAVVTALLNGDNMLRMVGMAYLSDSPKIRCSASIAFDFSEGGSITVSIDTVVIGHAIVERVG